MKERIWKDIKTYGPAVAAAAVLLFLCNAVFESTCPLTILCGLPCPGCGMTRASFALLTGRWGRAWQMNPAVFPLALWVVYFGARRYLSDGKARGAKVGIILVLLFMIGCYIVRMYLYFPQEEPYVYYEENMLEGILGRWHPFYIIWRT